MWKNEHPRTKQTMEHLDSLTMADRNRKPADWEIVLIPKESNWSNHPKATGKTLGEALMKASALATVNTKAKP
jgi:hypothetical protein